MAELIAAIQQVLTPELLKPEWRGRRHPLAGHCYVASEALYHLGAGARGYRPRCGRVGSVTHWWLEHPELGRLDPTAEQFARGFPYERGRGTGFLTKHPSKRARIVMDRARLLLP